MSRKEAVVFNNLLHEIIQRNIQIEDFVDKKTLQSLLQNSLYRGISIDNTTNELVADIMDDEMDLEFMTDLNQLYKEKHFYEYCSESYKQKLN